jgi:hypothetical protein
MSGEAGQLLLRSDTAVTCPKCANEFGLDQGFAKKALDQLSAASAGAITALRDAERAAVERRAQEIAAEQARSARTETESLKKLLKEQGVAHAAALAEVRKLAAQSVAPQIEQMRQEIADRDQQLQGLKEKEQALTQRERTLEEQVTAAAEAKAAEILEAERNAHRDQLAGKDAQLATLRNEQLALRKERQQLQDDKAALALEVQKQVDVQLQQRELVVRSQEQERARLEKAELQKKLDDAGEELAAAKRRMEQGSQQLQGEVLELAIEDGLRRAFPLDTIEEVKKGQRGGDVLQHVVTRTGQPAGTILWETKRAKDWSVQWLPKLKEDMRACGAAVGVLVTMPGAVPRDWPASAYFSLYDDVWVTHASCAVGVAEALRAALIDLQRQRVLTAGKGEKAEAMYDYVTSPQFAQKLRAVGEAFQAMRKELESEKTVTMQRWARREKQLDGGLAQLLGIGGGIQGLAQQELPELELGAEQIGESQA